MKIKELEKRINELEHENFALKRSLNLNIKNFYNVHCVIADELSVDPFYINLRLDKTLNINDAEFLKNKINELLDRIRKGEVR